MASIPPPKKRLWTLILVFLIFSGVVGTIGYFFLQEQEESIKGEKRSGLNAIADLKVNQIYYWMKERRGEAAVILDNTFILTYLQELLKDKQDPGLRQKALVWMDSLIKHYGYRAVFLIDGKGNDRIRAGDERESLGSCAKTVVAEVMRSNEVLLSDLHQGETKGEIHLDLVIPLFIAQGSEPHATGALLLRIDPKEFLYPLIQSWPMPSETAETLLVRREGEEVVFLNELRHQKGTSLTLRFPIDDRHLPAAMAARGQQGIVEGMDYRKVPVLAALRQIPDSPWYLIAKVDQKEIYAPIRSQARSIAILAGVLVAAMAAVVLLLWHGQQADLVKKQYEAEVKRLALAQRFGYLSKYANDIILLVDEDLRIIEANDRALATYGYTREELLQLSGADLRTPEARLDLDQQVKEIKERDGYVFETLHQRKDGTRFPVESSSRLIEVEGKRVYQTISRDITERKQSQEALRVSLRFLEIVHGHTEIAPLLKAFVSEIKGYTGCDAVGIRVLDENGRIPYLAYEGFSEEFYQLESPLSIASDQCMCINVIKGDADPGLPFYTKGGSFYINGTTRFLATVSEEEKGRTRNVCNQEGYESVALIPFRSGDRILGLIHVADHRENRVPLPIVEMLERAARQLGIALLRTRAEEALRESEERYRSLFENMLEGFAYCRMIFEDDKPQDFVYLAVNEMFETLTGLKEVTGKRVTEVIPGIRQADPELFDIYARVSLTGKPEKFERFVNALKMWFSISVYSPEKEFFVAVFDVITERKRTEEALRKSEERFRELYDHAPVGYHEYDTEGRVTNVNLTDFEMLGYTREEMIGRSIWEFNVERDRAHREVLEKLAGLRPPGQNFERTYLRKDGTTFPVLIQDRLTRDEKGRIAGIRSTIQDITERKRAEENLRQSEENAKRLAQENAIMAEIGRIISSTLYIEEVYEGFAEEVKKIIPFDRIVINLIDAEKGIVKNVYMAGEEVRGRKVEEIYPLEGSGNAEMVRTKSSLLIQTEDFHEYQDRFPMLLSTFQAGFRSILNVPLFLKGKIIGGLLLRSRKPYAYTDHDVGLAERIGSQIAGAIANAHLYTERVQAEKERAALEDQLRQAQKMEAVGQLAGGIAHDFNNLLTVIKGYDQISLMELKEGDPLRRNIEGIGAAANRAADLTRQLLAFSRRQIMEFKIVDLNRVVKDLNKMLQRILSEHIELVSSFSEDLGRIKADQGQIEQVVMNLIVNARDAMPNGGKLTIETANVELDEAYARMHVAVKPGNYVLLSVSDTGVGMAPEARERIFDPFFTTKETGKGTGLGLSTVYGIVKQSGGNIWVYSELGKGSTFKIYLPRVEEPLTERPARPLLKEELPRGNETILVVEDEKEVRNLAARILEKQGFRVLEASQGEEALSLCGKYKEPIHLLLTDVVMPKMGGRDAAKRCRQLHPETKVLYMSGYTDNAIAHYGVLDEGIEYLQKPFTVEALLRKVRDTLDK